MSVDPNIATNRRGGGVTREDLAHEAKLTTSSLARIELGQADPRWTTAKDITKALGVQVSDIAKRV